MKSPPAIDDCDDIFGPPRFNEPIYCPPKNRPSMISAKYRLKEERRRILKMSINKLKKIEDPETSLCRSVLINNTMKRLQKEARDEKIYKQQMLYPHRCYDDDDILNLKGEFYKNELRGFDDDDDDDDNGYDNDLGADFALETEFDKKISDEINVMNREVMNGLLDGGYCGEGNLNDDSNRYRKRSYDDIEDCDVQDVLSQLYMPPTPRMLTCIDEDEDVNVVDIDEPAVKRPKLDETNETGQSEVIPRLDDLIKEDYYRINNNLVADGDGRLQTANSGDANSFSCGHVSMFNEMQSNVFHSLITSLET